MHPEILHSEGLPAAPAEEKTIWHERYRSIVDFERHLTATAPGSSSSSCICRKEEQRKRFLARIDEPEKNWKFSLADIEERGYWNDYMKAYEDA